MTMSLRASVTVPLPIEQAWRVWVDAARFAQWQMGVVGVQDLSGPVDDVGTTFTLDHGPKLNRRVRVVASEPPVRHVIEQAGLGIRDQTAATFESSGGATVVTVVAYAHMNPLMELAHRLDIRGWSQRQLQRELDRFADVATRRPGPVRLGGIYLATAAATRRRLTVIGLDPDRVHIRLHPGHLRDRDASDLVPGGPKPPSDQMNLWPIQPPLRAPFDITTRGLPFLVRDGGHGVAHLVLSLDAWADASPQDVGTGDVTERDTVAVADWRRRGGPVVGVDADLALAPVCTLLFGVGDDGAAVWGSAKVLRSEVLRLHLSIPADRWSERPELVDAWRCRWLPDEPHGAVGRGAGEHADRVAIGHLPVDRSTFRRAMPQFAGVTTLEGRELEGYRFWREQGGGTFDTLEVVAMPPTLPGDG